MSPHPKCWKDTWPRPLVQRVPFGGRCLGLFVCPQRGESEAKKRCKMMAAAILSISPFCSRFFFGKPPITMAIRASRLEFCSSIKTNLRPGKALLSLSIHCSTRGVLSAVGPGWPKTRPAQGSCSMSNFKRFMSCDVVTVSSGLAMMPSRSVTAMPVRVWPKSNPIHLAMMTAKLTRIFAT